jgi:hypothetical protein
MRFDLSMAVTIDIVAVVKEALQDPERSAIESG